MLKLDRKAFGGLGQCTKMPGDIKVKSMDLHSGDAVLIEGEGVFTHRRKVFTQDEMQAAVATGVAALREAKPDWQLAAHPALNEWLRYEVAVAPAADTAPTTEPEAVAAEEAPAQSHKKSKKKAEPC
jgi:hypothetical protein